MKYADTLFATEAQIAAVQAELADLAGMATRRTGIEHQATFSVRVGGMVPGIGVHVSRADFKGDCTAYGNGSATEAFVSARAQIEAASDALTLAESAKREAEEHIAAIKAKRGEAAA